MRAYLLLASLLPAAPAGNVDITARVDRSEITIGDRLRYEIEIVHPASGRIELPSVLGNLGAFEVKDYAIESGKAKDGRAVSTHVFILSTFTVGSYTLPPQEVDYREGQDSMGLVLYTQPTEIRVKRTSPETVKDISDLADLADLPEPKPWGLMALAAAVLAAIGTLIWRRKRRKKSEIAVPPPLPPYEEALRRLRNLDIKLLLRQNQAREFAFSLSEILRIYVGRRYGVDALESTTEEFLDKAKPLPLPAGQLNWLRAFCESLDGVKYATGGILESEAARLVGETETFLDCTRPPPDPQGGQGEVGRKTGEAT